LGLSFYFCLMKKIFILLALFSATYAAAQTFFDLGFCGAWDVDFLYNKNISDDTNFRHQFSPGYSFGGKFGINFGERHSLCFEGGVSKFNQEFKYGQVSETEGDFPYRRKLSYNSVDFLVLYRHYGQGQYIELGPQYSLYKKPVLTDSQGNDFSGDVKDYMRSSNAAAVVGFGGNILKGGEVLFVTFGFRFKYHFMDLITEKGKTESFFTGPRGYNEYKKTNAITGALQLGIDYSFGYFAYAQCRGRRVFLAF